MPNTTDSTTSQRYLIVLNESNLDKDWCYEEKEEVWDAYNALVTKKSPDQNYTIIRVDEIKTVCDFHEEDDGAKSVDVTVTGLLGENVIEATFYVQMCNGYYLSQMGCWITTNGEDHEFTFDEKILFTATDVVKAAEDYYAADVADNVTYHDAEFNASIASQSVTIKEERSGDDATFTILVVNDDFNRADYNVPETKGMVFDNLEEAKEWLDDHRGDEHYDFEGLKRVISLINDHNNC